MACKQTRKTNWLARQGDAAGRILAYVYFEDEPTRRNFSKCLSKDDARRMAQQILRLPELVRIAKGIDPSEAQPPSTSGHNKNGASDASVEVQGRGRPPGRRAFDRRAEAKRAGLRVRAAHDQADCGPGCPARPRSGRLSRVERQAARHRRR